MAQVRQIIETKGNVVYWVTPDTSIEQALQLMADKGIGAVIVKQGDSIVGIFSERDFARKTLTIEGFHLGLPVRALMSKPVFFVKPDQSLEECMTLMTEKHIRHIPVMAAGKLVGIVSIRDVIKFLIADKNFEILELERFVSSQNHEGMP